MSACDFDDDFYDAIILVHRAGCARFTVDDLAPVLNISPTSVGHFIRKGVLEPPTYELSPRAGDDFPVWSPDQVARAMLARGLVR